MAATQPGRTIEAPVAAAHTEAGLSDEEMVHMYRTMLASRLLDERTWLLQRQGKIAFVVSCQGHEAAQVGAAHAFRRGEDYLFPYYRDIAVVLHMGMTARDVLLQSFSKAEDPNSGGRQMANHFGSKRLKMFSGSSPIATQIPHAAGVALAARARQEESVVYVSFGDAAASKGDFHEGTNFAAIHKLPVVLFCQNNGYAISVPLAKQMSVRHVADRAAGYGIPGVTVDGLDPVAVYVAVKRAVDRARRGEGPTLIDARVNRLTPHSSSDDDTQYRTAEELKSDKENDPVPAFANRLRDLGILTEERLEQIRREIAEEIDEATRYADKAPSPDPSTGLRHVFYEQSEE